MEIKELKGFQNGSRILKYLVKIDFNFKKPITLKDGTWSRFVILKKESEKGGWRIDGVGTWP